MRRVGAAREQRLGRRAAVGILCSSTRRRIATRRHCVVVAVFGSTGCPGTVESTAATDTSPIKSATVVEVPSMSISVALIFPTGQIGSTCKAVERKEESGNW